MPRIKHDIGLETMAHLTCVTKDELTEVLDTLAAGGIENVLALATTLRRATHF